MEPVARSFDNSSAGLSRPASRIVLECASSATIATNCDKVDHMVAATRSSAVVVSRIPSLPFSNLPMRLSTKTDSYEHIPLNRWVVIKNLRGSSVAVARSRLVARETELVCEPRDNPTAGFLPFLAG